MPPKRKAKRKAKPKSQQVGGADFKKILAGAKKANEFLRKTKLLSKSATALATIPKFAPYAGPASVVLKQAGYGKRGGTLSLAGGTLALAGSGRMLKPVVRRTPPKKKKKKIAKYPLY